MFFVSMGGGTTTIFSINMEREELEAVVAKNWDHSDVGVAADVIVDCSSPTTAIAEFIDVVYVLLVDTKDNDNGGSVRTTSRWR